MKIYKKKYRLLEWAVEHKIKWFYLLKFETDDIENIVKENYKIEDENIYIFSYEWEKLFDIMKIWKCKILKWMKICKRKLIYFAELISL